MSRRLLMGVTSLLLVASGSVRAEIKPEFLMGRDPDLRVLEPIVVFAPSSIEIWTQALQRPEIDLQRMAAETIAEMHERGMPDLAKTVPALEKIVSAESSHPVARFAAARALIALQSRGSSDKLLKASQQYGADLRLLVEPALARWNVESAKEIWVRRLKAAEVRPRDLLLAIQSLGETGESAVLPLLRSLTMDRRQSLDVRLEAASAAGRLADVGLETDAAVLCRSKLSSTIAERLCAIRLLARHTNDASRQLLTELAVNAEPAVAAAALRRLNDIDPALVLPLAETAMQNADPHVRQQGANSYLSLPTPDRMASVTLLLDDDHPEIRKPMRESLFRLASNAALSDAIRAAAMKVLSGDRWQGQEQASLLLGALEHTPASLRLVELLESPRDEVMLASAWGLKSIADPGTIDAILDKAGRQTIARKVGSSTSLDEQVAHLFEACGRMRAKQGIPLMKEYIPNSPVMGERSRSAAIWALGRMHQGTADKALSDAFFERIMDNGFFPPESPLVKQQSAIALGRMKDLDHGPALRKLLEPGTPNNELGLALRWAVKELTGEQMPAPTAERIGPGVTFLDPLQPPASNKP